MKLYHLINGPLRINTYILVNERSSTAAVIDCGENYKLLKQAEATYGFKIKAVLLTHAHFDHSGCAKRLQDDGAEIYISRQDSPKISNSENLASNFGRKFESFTPNYTFSDGDELCVEGITFRVILTPGHTDGSACFVTENAIFSGDTLFRESVGRTDFPSGNREDLVASVKRLFALNGDYNVYPGHEEFTTLSYERKYNTFIDYD